MANRVVVRPKYIVSGYAARSTAFRFAQSGEEIFVCESGVLLPLRATHIHRHLLAQPGGFVNRDESINRNICKVLHFATRPFYGNFRNRPVLL